MDPVINSQIQSPLVRTLTTVATKGDSFTHNIPDNVPPVSFNKQNITAYNGSTSTGQTFKFRIPQYGYWNKSYLKMRLTVPATTSTKTASGAEGTEWIKSITLKTHNKSIQTLYGDEIKARLIRQRGDEREKWLSLAKGFIVGEEGAATWTTGSQVIDFYVPLDLASLKAPHVNFSTRFVEDLEVHVETQSVNTFYTVASPTTELVFATMELVSWFHNFHDNTEQAIRNENYQPGNPATVLQYDTYEEQALTLVDGVNTIDLKSNNLAYGVTMVHTSSGAGLQWTHVGTATQNVITDVEFWGSGQRLYQADLHEVNLADDRDYNLAVRSENMANTFSGATLSKRMHYIPFGFQNNELINTGAVALQTVNNPQLRITMSAGTTTAATGQMKVYVHYHAMLRIDSDTGVITRSMDV